MKENSNGPIQIRTITLPDGRYLIFYTVDVMCPDQPPPKIAHNPHSQNEPSSQTERGSRV